MERLRNRDEEVLERGSELILALSLPGQLRTNR